MAISEKSVMLTQVEKLYDEIARLRADLEVYGGTRCLTFHPSFSMARRCLRPVGHTGPHIYATEPPSADGPIIVYIAGPITVGCQFTNVGIAIRAWHELRDLGYYPICPHLSGFSQVLRTRSFADWLDYDEVFVRASHSVLRLPGFSKGADRETILAGRLLIPVFPAVPDLHAYWKTQAPHRLRDMTGLLEGPTAAP